MQNVWNVVKRFALVASRYIFITMGVLLVGETVIKARMWNGKSLKGVWRVTIKVDGIRALRQGDKVVSRNGKPLYNLEKVSVLFTDAEIFLGDFDSTVTAVRTKEGIPVAACYVYSLHPHLDPRLDWGNVVDPSSAEIKRLLRKARKMGYEGLVLRQGETWLKVKKKETVDTTITGLYAGKGKHLGKLGGFVTPLGRVGSGLSDKQREEYNTPNLIGSTIECDCMERTVAGKLRHPRFIRLRPDK